MMAKKSTSPYTLQALTRDYLYKGTAPGDFDLDFPPVDSVSFTGYGCNLTDASIQATNVPGAPVQYFRQYFLTSNNVMVFVPRTDYTKFEYYRTWKLFSKLVKGVYYFGPYIVWGSMGFLTTGSINSNDIPLYDVEFSCVNEAMNLADLSAPFALLNGRYLYGWEPK